jgi:hypothetical protein
LDSLRQSASVRIRFADTNLQDVLEDATGA